MKRLSILLLMLFLAACAAPLATPTVSDPAEPLPTPPTAVPTQAPTSAPTPTWPPVTPLPENTLIVFVKEGGYAFTSITITVHTDGTAQLAGSEISIPVTWTIPTDQFKALQDLLNNPGFAKLAYDPGPGLGCDDCYVMTVRALNAGRSTTSLKYDQADLDMVKDISPLYDQLVVVMKDIENTAPVPGPIPTEQGITPKPGADLPANVLLTYNRAGGIAYSDINLVVYRDGTTDLAINATPQPNRATLSATGLAALTNALSQPGLGSLTTGKPSGACNDCYIYTVIARTPDGIVTLRADDAQLSSGDFPIYQQLLALLTPYLQ